MTLFPGLRKIYGPRELTARLSLAEFLLASILISWAFLLGSTYPLATRARPAPSSDRSREHLLSSFSTTLLGRTSGQKGNIRLAASLIDGRQVAAGQTFSFIGAVGPTTPERGFVKSSANREGEDRTAYGGGCCQLASTVYNAALRANMDIVKRSRHIWPVRSVPEGLDAAVNEETLDLELKNAFEFSVRLRVRIIGERLAVSFSAPQPAPQRVQIVRRLLQIIAAPEYIQSTPNLRPGEIKRVRRGRPGCRVVVERIVIDPDGHSRRESISDDLYGPRHGIVLTAAEPRR